MSAQEMKAGEGLGVLLDRNQEGIRKCDFEGSGGGVGVEWEEGGRVMRRELQMGLE